MGGAWASVAFLAVLAAGAFLPLAVMALPGAGEAIGSALADPVVWRSLRFTLLQAALSTALSLALAVPVAAALTEMRRFPGREHDPEAFRAAAGAAADRRRARPLSGSMASAAR